MCQVARKIRRSRVYRSIHLAKFLDVVSRALLALPATRVTSPLVSFSLVAYQPTLAGAITRRRVATQSCRSLGINLVSGINQRGVAWAQAAWYRRRGESSDTRGGARDERGPFDPPRLSRSQLPPNRTGKKRHTTESHLWASPMLILTSSQDLAPTIHRAKPFGNVSRASTLWLLSKSVLVVFFLIPHPLLLLLSRVLGALRTTLHKQPVNVRQLYFFILLLYLCH